MEVSLDSHVPEQLHIDRTDFGYLIYECSVQLFKPYIRGRDGGSRIDKP